VIIRHSDGTRSLEAHGRAGTVVPLGDYACGATLMQSASSGNSNSNHIHHESRDRFSRAFDPYEGPCDSGSTRWSSQNEYLGLPGTTCTD
jgi:hypothetical protein